MNDTLKRDTSLLFNYLKNILYFPEKATLDITALSEPFRLLGEGMVFLARCAREQKRAAISLSRGELQFPLPSADNPLGAPLKALHGTLSHLTWQTQQIAKGDYSQTLDFMGEFADSFNEMTRKLKQREDALEHSRQMLMGLTENTQDWIVVIDTAHRELLYGNRAVRQIFDKIPDFQSILLEKLDQYPEEALHHPQQWELEISVPASNTDDNQALDLYFIVSSQPLNWKEHEDAMTHILKDITLRRRSEQQMQTLAFQDALTHLYNRRYGMQLVEQWAEKKEAFTLCFVDIDCLKYVNDTYGHEEGDRYILSIASVLTAVPQPHIVCRIGGDEFMILSQKQNAAALEHVLETLRQQLIDTSSHQMPSYLRSFSYAAVSTMAGHEVDVSLVLGDADRRMYQYKFAQKEKRLAQNKTAAS